MPHPEVVAGGGMYARQLRRRIGMQAFTTSRREFDRLSQSTHGVCLRDPGRRRQSSLKTAHDGISPPGRPAAATGQLSTREQAASSAPASARRPHRHGIRSCHRTGAFDLHVDTGRRGVLEGHGCAARRSGSAPGGGNTRGPPLDPGGIRRCSRFPRFARELVRRGSDVQRGWRPQPGLKPHL